MSGARGGRGACLGQGGNKQRCFLWPRAAALLAHSPRELACKVQERLLVVVVALCTDLVVLQVLLAVECHLLGLDLAVLDVHLVAAQHDRDVFAHTAHATGGGVQPASH